MSLCLIMSVSVVAWAGRGPTVSKVPCRARRKTEHRAGCGARPQGQGVGPGGTDCDVFYVLLSKYLPYLSRLCLNTEANCHGPSYSMCITRPGSTKATAPACRRCPGSYCCCRWRWSPICRRCSESCHQLCTCRSTSRNCSIVRHCS